MVLALHEQPETGSMLSGLHMVVEEVENLTPRQRDYEDTVFY